MPNLPLAFVERMKALLGQDFKAFMDSFDAPVGRSFHLNRALISPEVFESAADFALERLPIFPGAYRTEAEGLGRHPFHHAGLYYVQEPSAMCVAAAVEIGKDWRMLDLCAAPGGKSSQLAMMAPEGLLVANDPVMSRCRILTQNIERMGYPKVITACLDVSAFSKTCPGYFDLTLVDAPCSGEGMFRKDEGAVAEWSPALVAMCAERQRGILSHAKETVRRGGYLLYSTCTWSMEENELNVARFLRDNPDFELAPCRQEIVRLSSPGLVAPGCEGIDTGLMRRFYPFGPLGGEGQFVALMRRRGGGERPREQRREREKLSAAERKIVGDFLRDAFIGLDEGAVFRRGEALCLFDPDFSPAFPMFSCGVMLGSIEKGRLKPAHQLFSALGRKAKRRIDLPLNDPRLAAYLKGETFPAEDMPEGWAAVLVCGAPLGGVKIVSGTAKNHYPKGLRSL